MKHTTNFVKMNLKAHVLLELNNKCDFIHAASAFFKESVPCIELALNKITTITTQALTNHCQNSKNATEILQIVKQCSGITFTGFTSNSQEIVQRGRGINTELFGVNLVNQIADIAHNTQTQDRTINGLMAINTPVYLSTLYKMGQIQHYNEADFISFLQTINTPED